MTPGRDMTNSILGGPARPRDGRAAAAQHKKASGGARAPRHRRQGALRPEHTPGVSLEVGGDADGGGG